MAIGVHFKKERAREIGCLTRIVLLRGLSTCQVARSELYPLKHRDHREEIAEGQLSRHEPCLLCRCSDFASESECGVRSSEVVVPLDECDVIVKTFFGARMGKGSSAQDAEAYRMKRLSRSMKDVFSFLESSDSRRTLPYPAIRS